MIGRRETAEIFRGFGLADPGNCKYWDIVGIGNIGHGHIALHSVHTSPPCRAHIIAYSRYRSKTGKFGRERKNCGKHHRKYLFLMSGAQCGDGCLLTADPSSALTPAWEPECRGVGNIDGHLARALQLCTCGRHRAALLPCHS